MSEFKGTKGKWKVKHLDDIFIENEFGEQICEMPARGIIRYETWLENAQLISHSPQLLEELKMAVKALKAVHSFGATTPIIERWEQLIQQATTIK